MGIFKFLTFLGAIGTVAAYMYGVRAESKYAYGSYPHDALAVIYAFLFYCAVFLTILSAPLAR